jgi:hypothetical protein
MHGTPASTLWVPQATHQNGEANAIRITPALINHG